MEPVIVLLHDMWHTPGVYLPYIWALEQATFRVHCPQLPTCNPSLPPDKRSVSNDLLVLSVLLKSLLAAGKKVIVVMHGYGGIIGSNIPGTLSFDYRAARGEPGGIIHLLYMCAYILPSDHSIANLGLCGNITGTHHFPGNPQQDIFAGVSSEEVQRCIRLLVPIPQQVVRTRLKQDAWRHIPCTYLFTRNDCALWLELQRTMAEPVKEYGKRYGQKVYDAGHSVYLTHTRDMVEEVQAICGVFWEQALRQTREQALRHYREQILRQPRMGGA